MQKLRMKDFGSQLSEFNIKNSPIWIDEAMHLYLCSRDSMYERRLERG